MSWEYSPDFVGAGGELTAAEEAWVQSGNNGILLLVETTAPSATSGTGKVYVKSSDSKLYFKDSGGTEFDLTASGSGIGGSTGATDNRLLRSNGTGGSTLQNTGITVDDSDNITGVTSITATTVTGALVGNADTATVLATARTINGVSFDGSANITVTAAAGTLTGTTLKSTVVTSSLTTVGTIATGVWNGTDIAVADGGTGSSTASGARTNLGVAIGSNVQAFGDVLDDFNTLGAAASDGQFIVATGAGVFAYESGATARASLGLGSAAVVATDLADLNEATIEAAIDTLANLTSIQSLTVTLADAGADAILGWDDTAGAYENLTQAEVLAIIGDASLTAKGVVELATTAETDTGTDAARATTPDGLAGSYAGTKVIGFIVVEAATDVATGTAKAHAHIPAALNGMNLVSVHAEVVTAGTTGVSTFDVNKNGTTMLSTKITIDSAETGSDTAATAAVIDTGADNVATNDVISIDIDGISTTAPQGLVITLEFRLP